MKSPVSLRFVCAVATVVILRAAPAGALPVFARIYNEPCGACHTTFPQLNPAGETFRAQGMHGLTPAFEPLRVGPGIDVPGTLPLAFYLAAGEDVTNVNPPGGSSSTRSFFNLTSFRILSGGEVGPHLAFMFDWELIETEADEGEPEILDLPYQAYVVGHAGSGDWLTNLKVGWYELPFTVSPQIHRLTARPYLAYDLTACGLLGIDPPGGGSCDDIPVPGRTQIGAEVNGLHTPTGIGWALGGTNGSDNRVHTPASDDVYLHVRKALDLSQAGVFVSYSPDIVGHGVDDRTLRVGPDLDVYGRRHRLLAQFLASRESNPTGGRQAVWYYGGFVEGNYRFTATHVGILRVDYAWLPGYEERGLRAWRQLWEVTGGWQWLVVENLKVVAEVTYGEDRGSVPDGTVNTWAGTLRFVTAFWPLTPPGMPELFGREVMP